MTSPGPCRPRTTSARPHLLPGPERRPRQQHAADPEVAAVSDVDASVALWRRRDRFPRWRFGVNRRQHQHARPDADVRADARSAETLEVGMRADQRPVADKAHRRSARSGPRAAQSSRRRLAIPPPARRSPRSRGSASPRRSQRSVARRSSPRRHAAPARRRSPSARSGKVRRNPSTSGSSGTPAVVPGAREGSSTSMHSSGCSGPPRATSRAGVVALPQPVALEQRREQ